MAVLLLALAWSDGAMAAICTTNPGTGTWNTASTWSCGRVPLTTDTVVISRNITLDQNRTVAGLTINTGVVLNDGGRTLTVAGNVINNGTYGVSGGGGRIQMTVAGTTISGTGTFNDSDLYIDANNITLPTGSTMNFTRGAQIRVGSGSTASFTMAGTITDTGATSGNRIMRVYGTSTLTISGTLNVPNSYLQIRSGGTVLNGGTVAMQYLDGSSAATVVWSQLTNSSLTITMPVVSWGGTFDANATGNTVTYNGTSTPLTPSANTYFNLAGTGVTCPHGFTVIGTDPCAGSTLVSVTLNPSNCVNVTGIGTQVWGTPAFAVSSDNTFAIASLNDLQVSNYLRCTGYGFAIPAGATISGITVRVERKASNTGVQDAAMRLVRDASGSPAIQATDRSTTTAYTTADVSEPHGGVADLWGGTWTAADINSANFGAAFASKKPGTAGGARTVSVDHIVITVTYSAPPAAPHHIQINHDGIGLTCRAEALTVTACANAACTAPHFNSATVTGNVTWAGTPGGTLPFTIASGGAGQTTVSLAVTSAQTVTLGTSAVTPTQTNPPSTCINSGGGAACNMIISAASACFDAVEVGAAISTPIYTKRAGSTPFQLDVLSGSSYTGTLTVELVDASAGSCATYPQLNTQGTTFTSQTRKTLSFTYANAAKNVKVRITGLAASSCSTDRFAIRPDSFTSVVGGAPLNMNNAGTSGTPKAVAGTGAGAGTFTLIATTGIAGYTGTPKINNTAVQAHVNAKQNGSVGGAFPAAVSGTSTGTSAFTYSEVGNFRFLGSAAALGSTTARGVYDDTFTAVDQPNDCTNDFSNTLSGAKYGCKFGITANSSYFGRFYPHHFDTLITEVTPGAGGTETACNDGFTYSAQPFIVQVLAKNSAGVGTLNYDMTAGFSNATTLSDGNAVPGGSLNNTGMAAAVFLSGVGTTPDPTISSSPNYTFTVPQTAPVTIKLRATENAGADGVSSSTGTAEDTMEIRSGRLFLGNAHGTELLGLTIPIETRYWTTSSNYETNSADDCTMIPASSITMGAYTKNLVAPCKTWLAPIGDLVFSGGQLPASLTLSAPGSGNNGSVDLLVNVGVVASGNTCLSATPSAATAADVPWLTTNKARATFGVYKGANEFIYQRENY